MGLFDSIGNFLGGAVNGLTGAISNTDKFQAADPYSTSQFAEALAHQTQLYQQQQTLAQALQARALGQGPNPALSQLHQTTDQNAQAAAGLLASQRGLNPALAARLAATAQTTANQTAGGQAATLAAQQQIAGQDQLAGLYGNMANQGLNQQQLMDQTSLGTQKINAGVADQNAGQQFKLDQGVINSAGAAVSPKLGGMAGAAHGGVIPGEASVSGDSKSNDTVPTMLSPGEIVIPRSHADNAKDAKSFIDELMSRKKAKSAPSGFGKVLEAHRALTKALEAVK